MPPDNEEKKAWENGKEEGKGIFLSPDGHALPRPLDPVVTMEVVQRYVEADRAKNRRLLFWTSSFFLLIILVLLILFVVIGIYVVKRSHQAAKIANDASTRTAVYAAEVVSISNKLASVEEKENQIRSVVNRSESEITRRNRLLKSDLERFSKWVQENLQGRTGENADRAIESLKARIVDLEQTILRLEKIIEEERNKTNIIAAEQKSDTVKTNITQAQSSDIPLGKDTSENLLDNLYASSEISTDIFERTVADLNISAPERQPIAESEVSVVIFPNGDCYKGQFKDGLFHGWGVYTYANGDKYEGEFAQDMKNGWGTLTYANGDKYVGTFKNDVREGRGNILYKNGDRYVGEFKNDVPNGKGVIFYANGNKYAGDLVNGLKHGNGVFQFANGDIYKGEFRQDERNGRGSYNYHDGSKYIGEFRSNVRHGKGRYVYPGGEEYIGEFKDGMKDGTGICIYPNGTKVHVQWRKDALVKVLDS